MAELDPVLREQLARAICVWVGNKPDDGDGRDPEGPMWRCYLPEADQFLALVHTHYAEHGPTEEMEETMWAAFPLFPCWPLGYSNEKFEELQNKLFKAAFAAAPSPADGEKK
jgi:hypothetical protein